MNMESMKSNLEKLEPKLEKAQVELAEPMADASCALSHKDKEEEEEEEETQYDSGNDEQVSASSEDSEHFFEGVEKRLMLYLANKDGGGFNAGHEDEDSDSVCNSGDDAELSEPDLRKITK